MSIAYSIENKFILVRISQEGCNIVEVKFKFKMFV